MKSSILIVLAALAVCLSVADQESHISSVGNQKPGDRLLWRFENVAVGIPDVRQRIMAQVQLSNTIKVNYVTFEDKDPSSGGFVSYMGGFANNHLTVMLQSQWDGGFHFITDLYGQDSASTEPANLVSSAVQTNCTLTVEDGKTTQIFDCNLDLH
nr:uncharacterized protein LOC126053568 [Helicoverpa armigera]